MIKVLSIGRIHKLRSSNRGKFVLMGRTELLVLRALLVYSVIGWALLLKESTGRRNSIKAIVHLGHLQLCGVGRAGDGACVVQVVGSRAWIFTHFLHFFHIGESLRSGIETVIWIVFTQVVLELLVATDVHSFHHLEARRVVLLESKPKGRLGLTVEMRTSIGLISDHVGAGTRSNVISRLIEIHWRLIGIKLSRLIVFWSCVLESLLGRWEDRILVRVGLLLVVLDRLEECTTLHHDVFILNGNHLIKIDGLSLVLGFRRLVIESGSARSERLKMVSSAKLVIKNFELILNLSVVCARSWVDFGLFWDLVHEVSLNWWDEGVVHVWIGDTKAWTHRLQDLLLGLILVKISLVFDRSWWLKMARIAERHDGDISAEKIVSLSRWPEVKIAAALD